MHIRFGDLVEENGKTIRENNLRKRHNIPVGALVEFKTDNQRDSGAHELIHARYWVVEHGRDCDGTPLYWLSHTKKENQNKIQIVHEGVVLNIDVSRRIVYGWIGGFSEKSLMVINPIESRKNPLE